MAPTMKSLSPNSRPQINPAFYSQARRVRGRNSAPIRGAGNSQDLLAELIASGASMSTILIATQLVDAGKQGANILIGVNHLRDVRKAHQQRVEDLQNVKNFMMKVANNGDDADGKFGIGEFTAHLPQFIADHPDVAKRYGLDKLTKQDFESTITVKDPRGVPMATTNPVLTTDAANALSALFGKTSISSIDGKVEITRSHEGQKFSAGGFDGSVGFTADELEQLSKEHQNAQSDIDTQQKIMNMRLQEIVQHKQRLSSLASNLADAEHRMQDAVIKNTRS